MRTDEASRDIDDSEKHVHDVKYQADKFEHHGDTINSPHLGRDGH